MDKYKAQDELIDGLILQLYVIEHPETDASFEEKARQKYWFEPLFARKVQAVAAMIMTWADKHYEPKERDVYKEMSRVAGVRYNGDGR